VLDFKACEKLKEIGNALYAAKEYEIALQKYSKCIRYAEALFWIAKIDDVEVKKIPFLSNRAACNVQLKRWQNVVSDCKEIIFVDQKNPKAYCE